MMTARAVQAEHIFHPAAAMLTARRLHQDRLHHHRLLWIATIQLVVPLVVLLIGKGIIIVIPCVILWSATWTMVIVPLTMYHHRLRHHRLHHHRLHHHRLSLWIATIQLVVPLVVLLIGKGMIIVIPRVILWSATWTMVIVPLTMYRHRLRHHRLHHHRLHHHRLSLWIATIQLVVPLVVLLIGKGMIIVIPRVILWSATWTMVIVPLTMPQHHHRRRPRIIHHQSHTHHLLVRRLLNHHHHLRRHHLCQGGGTPKSGRHKTGALLREGWSYWMVDGLCGQWSLAPQPQPQKELTGGLSIALVGGQWDSGGCGRWLTRASEGVEGGPAGGLWLGWKQVERLGGERAWRQAVAEQAVAEDVEGEVHGAVCLVARIGLSAVAQAPGR
ncbi:hypothetical protein CYMTET_26496 [Cymbomonas tetramitiformis]|uniref:Uncharacterized protein n=1 Tax=Cymbomonas tetramitiformis TaxID=36881 RepID=A0AAE0FSD6_9CHLO|nr:hypothetical protein CYMTET_26496 [Cymbomonas tetramitiformis]